MPPTKADRSAQDLDAVLERIAGWPAPYDELGRWLHEAITTAGPGVAPRLWYGAPGYATGRSAPVLVFFRCDEGVMSLGLSPKGTVEREPGTTLRPSAWFLDELDDATLDKVAALTRTAFG